MREIVTRVYKYSELRDARAKERAREWLRTAMQGDNFFAEYPSEEFAELLKACGFNVNSGHGHEKLAIYWSGFSSQGDGAAFSGTWYAADCRPAAWLADRPISYRKRNKNGKEYGAPIVCPHNERWHKAIAPLVALAIEYPHASGTIDQSHRGFWMRLESFDTGREGDDLAHTQAEWDAINAEENAAGERFIECARDLANAFYRSLEAEYEYQNSDAQIIESLKANEYEFTRDGERA